MKKIALLLICVVSMVLGIFVSRIWYNTHSEYMYSINYKTDKIELIYKQKDKICTIKRDIKGFNEMTILNRSGAVAHVRWMVEGPPSIMDAHLNVVSKKNGAEEVEVLNPDYSAD